MSNRKSKYADLFDESMSSIEARYVLYSHCDGLSKEERDELFAAYDPVREAILRRECKDARENSYMM